MLMHAASSSDIGVAIGSLLAAANWAKAHAALIALAIQNGGPSFDPERPPTLHLMTPSVRECRALPEAGIHLHLLARVEVEGKTGWCCAEIG